MRALHLCQATLSAVAWQATKSFTECFRKMKVAQGLWCAVGEDGYGVYTNDHWAAAAIE
jgi:hypothetical protein